MNKRHLIFEGDAHSVVYFVQAPTATEALKAYIEGLGGHVVVSNDGIVQDGGNVYPHPLAYIEATAKTHGEWQIRELPDWVWQGQIVEAFCGESAYGVSAVVDDCRKHFAVAFPRAHARAFVWYLKEGTLVTFYRMKARQMTVLRRYRWHWDGNKKTLEGWNGDYEEIMNGLLLVPFKPTTFVPV